MEQTGHRKRLWERFTEKGLRDGFHHDYEKLEFILIQIIPRKDTKAIAKDLLTRFGNLNGVFHASLESLKSVEGMGERSAGYLKLLLDVGLVLSEERLEFGDLLSSPERVKEFLIHEIGWEEAEYFVVIFLDSQNRYITRSRMFRGTLDRSAVFPREVAKEALACNASGLLVAHNHPSGHTMPSSEDISLTRKLSKSLSVLGLQLHDHFVVGKNEVLSLRERGDM